MRCDPLRRGTGGARSSGTGVRLRSDSWFSGASRDSAGLKQGVKSLLQGMKFFCKFSQLVLFWGSLFYQLLMFVSVLFLRWVQIFPCFVHSCRVVLV